MGVNYSDTIERMRWAGKLKNDSAVARKLGVTPQALSNYKKRGELPTDLVIRFSGIYGLSVDWLLSGDGDVYRIGYQPAVAEGGVAAETSAAYGRGTLQGLSGAPDITAMSADQIIYVGKLLKILRGTNKNNADAIKWSIDAFCKASTLQSIQPPKSAAPGVVAAEKKEGE
ncbi:MAG: helix-turn-helix domain-containing protein [Thermodesulfobacteriota bacterium]